MAEITGKSDTEFLKLPLDAQGFATAFSTEEAKEALEFFKKYGIVVFKDVLTKDEQNATTEALYKYLKDTRPTFDRDDYSTWENKLWPSDMKFGFFSDFPIFHLKEGWDNRQNVKVHKAFSIVWEREDLWVSFDRFGFMRPTMNLKINGKKCNRSAWRTTETFLHLDQNPLLDPEFCRVQGILNLKDNKLDDGGFQGVPGSHKQFKEWGTKHKSSIPPTSHLVTIPSDDIQQKHIQKIPLRAGSLLIWDSRVSHGNFPNRSSSPRIVQYITMWPNKEDNKEHVKVRTQSFTSGERVNNMKIVGHGYNRPRWVRKNFVPPLRPTYTPPELTELGKKLCGIKKWKENDAAETKREKNDKSVSKKRKVCEVASEEENVSEEEPKKKRSKPNARK